MITDPIADLLTRIRNANMAKLEKVDMPASKIKIEIIKILKEKGFIKSFKVLRDRKQGVIRITLKYLDNNDKALTGLKRVSTPGRRVYVDKTNIPVVMGGYGIAILSTSKGLFPDEVCRQQGIGGEVLCSIW
ncbi:MAG: 30S ribosomal protein S8 [Nitrospirae bacterium]|nr:30S ribosomal protein S8 [Nitrospirota bacterium]